nr:hypothetical protein [Clostridia bacterium]
EISKIGNAQTVSGWNKNNKSEAEVKEFAAMVTEAHGLYNGLTSEAQAAYVGKQNIDNLFAVEQALRAVKNTFGIKVGVSKVVVSPESTHKTEYNVGDRFSLSGLKVLVTYEDYYEETIDAAGNFTLRYDSPLTSFDEIVTLDGAGNYSGRSLRVIISVKAQSSVGGESTGNGSNGGSDVPVIIAIVVGAVALLAVAAVVTVLVLRKKGIILTDKKVSETEPSDDEVKALLEDGEEAAANTEQTENTGNTEETETAESAGNTENSEDSNGEEGTTTDD